MASEGDDMGSTRTQDCTRGRMFYKSTTSDTNHTKIPPELEDQVEDLWNYDTTKKCWRNTRTGRITFLGPKSHPQQTYLDSHIIAAHLRVVEKDPDADEAKYRRVTSALLRWLFENSSKEVYLDKSTDTTAPHSHVFKVECIPGPSFPPYDVLLAVCNKADVSWSVAIEQCVVDCRTTKNTTQQVYAMVQVGMDVQFFEWGDSRLIPLSNRLHVRRDASSIMHWAKHIEDRPLPAVL